MPTHIRALIVVVAISAFCFVILARPAGKVISPAEFRRWRNLWLTITCVAFLVGNFWLFAFISTFIIIFYLQWKTAAPTLYWLLLCIIPPTFHSIPGFGIVNRLFELNMPRLLSIVLLLPAFFFVRQYHQQQVKRIVVPDYIVILFLLLALIASFRPGTLTVGLRATFVLFLDIMLPYFVFSRRIISFRDVKQTIFAYLLPLFVFGVMGGFEMIRHWKLYFLPGISNAGYVDRAGALRASVTAANPIAFGFIMMIGIGLLLPLASRYLTRVQSIIAFGSLGLGLMSSLSRGPWVGLVALMVVYIATGRNATIKLAAIGFAGIISLPIMAVMPFWPKIVGLIPFIGTIESGNIDYRERLFEQSWIVIKRNPWFGSIDYLKTPEMQSMIQGEGIIDLVNTYIQIALEYGFVGLFLFTGFFGFVLLNVRSAYKNLPEDAAEMKQFGRAIFATLFAVLVTIATVSNVSFIAYLYWSLAGLSVAYVNVARNHTAEENLTDQDPPESTSMSQAKHPD